MLSGNAYVLILGLGATPDSLMRLHPSEVEIVTTPKQGITGYRFQSDGQVVIYPPDRVIHARTPSFAHGPRGLYGTGTIEPLTREINADINAQKLASTASAKGRPDILITPTDPADVWGRERRREILDQYKGLANEGGAMVLSGQVAVEPLKITPREMEFEASRTMARQSISAVMGVPPTVLGLPSANFATAKQQSITYWQNQTKAAKRIDMIMTKIAKLFDDSLSVEHDFSTVEALQDVRNAQLDRIGRHIMNGMSAADAYAYEGLADAPIQGQPVSEVEPADEEEEAARSIAAVIKSAEPIDLREERRKAIWLAWVERTLDPAEKRIQRSAARYLRGAKNRYIKRFRAHTTLKAMVNGSVVRSITD